MAPTLQESEAAEASKQDEVKIYNLMEMGFERTAVVAALEASGNGDEASALGYLLTLQEAEDADASARAKASKQEEARARHEAKLKKSRERKRKVCDSRSHATLT